MQYQIYRLKNCGVMNYVDERIDEGVFNGVKG